MKQITYLEIRFHLSLMKMKKNKLVYMFCIELLSVKLAQIEIQGRKTINLQWYVRLRTHASVCVCVCGRVGDSGTLLHI